MAGGEEIWPESITMILAVATPITKEVKSAMEPTKQRPLKVLKFKGPEIPKILVLIMIKAKSNMIISTKCGILKKKQESFVFYCEHK